jgi:hypothetical protein
MGNIKSLVSREMIPAYQLNKGDHFTDQDKKRSYEVESVDPKMILGKSGLHKIIVTPDQMVFLLSKQISMPF